MRALLEVILIALEIYIWLLIASAVLSWLIAFNVVNTRNQFVSMLWDFLYRITEPALKPDPRNYAELGWHRHLSGHPHPHHHLHSEGDRKLHLPQRHLRA